VNVCCVWNIFEFFEDHLGISELSARTFLAVDNGGTKTK